MEQGHNIGKDIQKIIFHYLSYYKLFVTVVFILILVTFFYNKSLIPIYKNNVSIHLIKDAAAGITDFNFETSLAASQLGMRYGMGMEDELVLMNSFSTIQKSLEQLEFEISYYRKDTIFPKFPVLKNTYKEIELYETLPFQIQYDASHPQIIYQEFSVIKLSDSTFRISANIDKSPLFNFIDYNYVGEIPAQNFNEIVTFNTVIDKRFMNLELLKTKYFDRWKVGEELNFKFNNLELLTLEYRDAISIYQDLPTSYIFHIDLLGKNYAKITAFLNVFAENLLTDDLSKKNALAKSTINFINAQLGNISDSLDIVKSNLQRFRSTNKVTDLSFQGQRLFDLVAQVDNEKATLQVQERYYNYLIEYLTDNTTEVNKELVSPASMNVIDPLLNNMIIQLSGLYSQYNNYSESSTSSIYLKDLKIKIKNQESAILENAKNNLSTIQMSINELDYRIEKANNKIAELPRTELKLIDIEREFKLNDAVLTFLMQKRSEAQIAMASTKPSYEIIDPARYLSSNPVAPKTKLNYILAFLIGIIIPFLYILIKDFLDNKIREKSDIPDVNNNTFLGSIHKHTGKEALCVLEQPDSVITESIRAVRTNIQFILNSSSSKVLAFTSSTSGEGKSFVASNMATSYAQSGAKTVILEFDLRRPQVGKVFGVHESLGLTSFLSNNANIHDIIFPSPVIENLDLILAGNQAPNPAELIASDRTGELFEYLRSTYDIIIIDTAPVGIVSESLHLLNKTDLNIFVTRQDYSIKEMVAQTVDDVKKAGITKLALLFNDISGKAVLRYKQSSYRKYYVDEQPKRFSLKSIFKR